MRRIAAWMLALVCLMGSALAADMSEVRGYDKSAKSDYQYMYMGSYPYDEDGTERALLWRILGRDGDTITLITEYIIDVQQEMKVDNYQDAVVKHKFLKTTEFEDTYLYEWINTDMAATILKYDDFSPAIIEAEGGLFHIMSYAEMKVAEFGFPNSRYGYTAENPWEKPTQLARNRQAFGTPYARTHMLYDDWKNTKHPAYNKLSLYRAYGNSSPYWARFYPEKERTELGAIVGANGHLSVHGKADVQVGVRPAMLLDLSKLVITGGDGSLENPWTMALTTEAQKAAEGSAFVVTEEAGGSGEVAESEHTEEETAEAALEEEESADLETEAAETSREGEEKTEAEPMDEDAEEYAAAVAAEMAEAAGEE